MIGAIAGDIAGSRFEGGPPPPTGFDLMHPDCRFTDDTVCTLAVAAAIMDDAGFASTLKDYVRRHPRRGYGGMFLDWAMSERAGDYGSWGNGAPMRVAAVGWLAVDPDGADRMAAAQAKVSHGHPDAISAAQAVARAILAFRSGSRPEAVEEAIRDRFGYDLRPETALAGGGFDVSAAGTTPAALSAALQAADWEAAVRTAIGLGGDTDTLACIAGAVAEARFGVPVAIAEQARSHLTADLLVVLDRFERDISAGRPRPRC